MKSWEIWKSRRERCDGRTKSWEIRKSRCRRKFDEDRDGWTQNGREVLQVDHEGLSQDASDIDMRCSQRWKKKIRTLYASTTSLEKTCHGMHCAKLVHQN